VGAVALAAAIQQLEAVGMDKVAEHEAELTSYALKKLGKIEGVLLFGNTDPGRSNQRVGVIPFNLKDISHFLVAAVLGYEFGIGVRNGCFCAHPYILHLLGVSNQAVDLVRQKMLANDRRENPGLVRASFGLYNTLEEIDRFGEALQKIIRGEYYGRYKQDRASGDFVPAGWTPEFQKIFHI
jgi:selenocysteine lyase/cysteine desulfurase